MVSYSFETELLPLSTEKCEKSSPWFQTFCPGWNYQPEILYQQSAVPTTHWFLTWWDGLTGLAGRFWVQVGGDRCNSIVGWPPNNRRGNYGYLWITRAYPARIKKSKLGTSTTLKPTSGAWSRATGQTVRQGGVDMSQYMNIAAVPPAPLDHCFAGEQTDYVDWLLLTWTYLQTIIVSKICWPSTISVDSEATQVGNEWQRFWLLPHAPWVPSTGGCQVINGKPTMTADGEKASGMVICNWECSWRS